MSGTSVDRVDFAYINTNGTDYVKIICGKTYRYSNKYKQKIQIIIKKLKKNEFISLKDIDKIVSKNFYKLTKKFLKEFKINIKKIHYIGLSGQTVLHKPNKKKSIQLGSGKYLSKKLKINVISDFRKNDLKNGGEGAPIACFYNHYLANKIKKKVAFINIGGVSNLCYVNNKKIIAFDLGPGNAQIDDFMWKNFHLNYDLNGNIAKKGNLNLEILNLFVKDKYFKKTYPKSLDREYFGKFNKKFYKIEIKNTINTLSMMTVYSIKNGLELLIKDKFKIDLIILTGGGRKNKFIYNKLKELTNNKIINIDEIGYNGDLIEAEAFAYLAIRSIKKLALSTPQTTGVKRSTTGGILN